MILCKYEGGFETLPKENVEYERFGNSTYAPEFIIDGIHYTTVNMMESFITYGEENAHHILVADVLSKTNDTRAYCAHELTIDYYNKKITLFAKD